MITYFSSVLNLYILSKSQRWTTNVWFVFSFSSLKERWQPEAYSVIWLYNIYYYLDVIDHLLALRNCFHFFFVKVFSAQVTIILVNVKQKIAIRESIFLKFLDYFSSRKFLPLKYDTSIVVDNNYTGFFVSETWQSNVNLLPILNSNNFSQSLVSILNSQLYLH